MADKKSNLTSYDRKFIATIVLLPNLVLFLWQLVFLVFITMKKIH